MKLYILILSLFVVPVFGQDRVIAIDGVRVNQTTEVPCADAKQAWQDADAALTASLVDRTAKSNAKTAAEQSVVAAQAALASAQAELTSATEEYDAAVATVQAAASAATAAYGEWIACLVQ